MFDIITLRDSEEMRELCSVTAAPRLRAESGVSFQKGDSFKCDGALLPEPLCEAPFFFSALMQCLRYRFLHLMQNDTRFFRDNSLLKIILYIILTVRPYCDILLTEGVPLWGCDPTTAIILADGGTPFSNYWYCFFVKLRI